MAFERVMPLDELWVGELRPCSVGGTAVLLLRLEDGPYAYLDRCPHLGVPLSRGALEEGVLTCAAHHYCYAARTGAGINPRSVRLTALALSVRDGVLWVDPCSPRGPVPDATLRAPTAPEGDAP